MNKVLKSEKGSTIIETLVALAFIGVVSTSFLNVAILSRKLSYRNRLKNELNQHANMVIEEIAKDYILNKSLTGSTSVEWVENYCSINSSKESGKLVAKFLAKYPAPISPPCAISSDESGYKVTLSVSIYDKDLSAERTFQIK